MSSVNLADLIDEYNEIKGALSFKPDLKKLVDKSKELVVLCSKSVGQSHFSLVRNQDFEIIFTHQTCENSHQCRLDLNSFSPTNNPTLLLNWGPDYCELRWDFQTDCCDGFL